MELELFSFVFCVKNLSPNVLGKLFFGVSRQFDCSKTGSSFQREFRFQIEHIPGSQNVVVDGRTRIFYVDYEKLPEKIKYCFKEDSTQRIFRIEEEDVEDANPGDSDEEGNDIIFVVC
jgi:hypothetical protein